VRLVLVSIKEAAQRLGVVEATVRRHIRNRELVAHQVPRPQGFVWMVELPDDETGKPDNNGMSEELVESLRDTIRRQDETIDQLQEQLQSKDGQLESKDRQIEQLHVLLQQAQAALPAPKEDHLSWWQRLWHRNGR
jgi:excisionase family DNA binding protein